MLMRMQEVRKAYKFRIKTTKEIEGKLIRFCGSGRFLWNKSLAMNLDRLENKQALCWYNELEKAKSGLNKSILDQGWGECRCQCG